MTDYHDINYSLIDKVLIVITMGLIFFALGGVLLLLSAFLYYLASGSVPQVFTTLLISRILAGFTTAGLILGFLIRNGPEEP